MKTERMIQKTDKKILISIMFIKKDASTKEIKARDLVIWLEVE